MEHPVSNQDYFQQTFDKLDLISASLESARFEKCVFNNCNFTSAQLTRCKFTQCTFNHCNLSVTGISWSTFYEVAFNECKLSGIDWTRAQWPTFNLDPELQFTQCLLTNASFQGLKLNGLRLDECKLHEVDFRECDLANATITGCDLAGSLFNNTNLRAADFTDSWNFTIDVMHNTVARAKFSRLEAVNLLEGLGIELVD